MKSLTEEQIVENLEKLNEGKLTTYLFGIKNHNIIWSILLFISIICVECIILIKYPELDLFMCVVTGGLLGAYFGGNQNLYIGSTTKKLLFVETKWSSFEFKKGLVIEKKDIKEIKQRRSILGYHKVFIKYQKKEKTKKISYLFYNRVLNKNLISQEDNAIKYLEILEKYSN